MAPWFFLALVPPLVWSFVNHLDKFIIARYFRRSGAGGIMIFTALAELLVGILIAVFNRSLLAISPAHAALIVTSGAVYIVSLIPYVYAMQRDEASIVTALYQSIPLFTVILAYLALGETISLTQFVAILFVVGGAVLITVERCGHAPRIRTRVLGLIALSSLLFAANAVIFKLVAVEETFWVTTFWEAVGAVLAGLALLFAVRSFRKTFLATWQTNATRVLSLNFLSDGLNAGAKLLYGYTTLLAPLALVTAVNRLQPLMVLILGVAITKLVPKFGKERVDRRTLIRRFAGIATMLVGVFLLNAD